MNCRKIKKYFSAYFEDELGFQEVERVKSHLQRCERCNSEWKDFRHTVQSVRAMPIIEPSEYFNARLLSKISELESESQRSKGKFWSPIFAPLSLALRPSPFALTIPVLLLFVGWQLYQIVSPSSETSYIQSQNVNQSLTQNSLSYSNYYRHNPSVRFVLPDVSVSSISKSLDSDEELSPNLVLPVANSSGIETETEINYILTKVSFSDSEKL